MRWRITLVVIMAAFAGACAVVDSSLIDEGPHGACMSGAGSYYLPKTHLQVTVVEHRGTGDAATGEKYPVWNTAKIETLRFPDPARGYCLDYLRSSSSEDEVTIRKYKAQPLLALITSDVTDRSLEISEAIIKTIFTAVSGNPDYSLTSTGGRDFGSISGGKVVRLALKSDYDPFDPERSAGLNQSLTRFGFCLILEQYTFDLRRASIDQYCDSPIATSRRATQHKFEYSYRPPRAGEADRNDPTLATRGLYYRPRIMYHLYIFTKQDPEKRGGWKLAASEPVALENIAPIMSIGVDRTMFAQRKTTLVFDEGMLKDACHYKGSELEAAAKIPVVVAQSVVALPANIMSVRIDQTKDMDKLVEAQNNMIKTQASYLADLNNQTVTSGTQQSRPTIAKTVPGLAANPSDKLGYADNTFDYATPQISDADLVKTGWDTGVCKPATTTFDKLATSPDLLNQDAVQ